MSWDNVTGVSIAYIWTDNPDMTQAYLFANGNHQVKVTVGVSFNLQGEGPTEEEVKAAIFLLDYNTGAGISHLKSVGQGEYLSVYLPTMPEQPKAIADSNGKAYQYEFDFYLSSDSSINPNFSSENVAVLVSYTNADGNVEYSTASGSSWQSYVAVTVYPPKKYGMSDSGRTPVSFDVKNSDFQIDFEVVSGWLNHAYEPSATLYNLRIDDSYFRFSKFMVTNTPLAPQAFLQHNIKDDEENDSYWYTVSQSFLPQENSLYSSNVEYHAEMMLRSEDGWDLIKYTAKFDQGGGEILFAQIKQQVVYVKDDKGPGPISNAGGQATLTAYDQFGNPVNIVVQSDGGGDANLKLESAS